MRPDVRRWAGAKNFHKLFGIDDGTSMPNLAAPSTAVFSLWKKKTIGRGLMTVSLSAKFIILASLKTVSSALSFYKLIKSLFPKTGNFNDISKVRCLYRPMGGKMHCHIHQQRKLFETTVWPYRNGTFTYKKCCYKSKRKKDYFAAITGKGKFMQVL